MARHGLAKRRRKEVGLIAEFQTEGLLRRAIGDFNVDAFGSELTLGPEPLRFDGPAGKIVFILYSARSGSTYMSQLLSNHPGFGKVSDWFWARRLERIRSENGLATHDEAMLHAFRNASGEVFATKGLLKSLTACALAGFLDQNLDRMLFFQLRRRDVVAQAVSIVNARLTGRYHSPQEAQREVASSDYDFAMIDEKRALIEYLYELQDKALDSLGRPAPLLYYEDIVADPKAFLKQMADAAGLEMPSRIRVDTRVRKLGDAVNREWCERYRAEKGGALSV